LESWAQQQILDLPAALPPIYSDLTAMNASLTSLPDTTPVIFNSYSVVVNRALCRVNG
jgi:hypothetical protein